MLDRGCVFIQETCARPHHDLQNDVPPVTKATDLPSGLCQGLAATCVSVCGELCPQAAWLMGLPWEPETVSVCLCVEDMLPAL